ncbi:MAG: O-antigen ligase domain-containing protein [Clostridia bacterium]|nr:O-antigen ligase domain-containing protein [Clostridia bacterium]
MKRGTYKMKEKSTVILERFRSFLMSEYFMAISFVIAAIIVLTRQEIYGAIGFILIIAALLIICDDVIVTTLPFLLLSCFASKCKGSFDIFIGFWWVAIIIIFSVVFHFVFYRKQKDYSMGKSFWAIFVVSIAVTLGGAGIITAKEYFAGVSLYNIAGLGFGMLLAYFLMNASFKPSDKYMFSDRFSKIMVATAVFCCFMIVHHYIMYIDSFFANPRILQFQWRNNISTMLMLAMPFVFYMAAKKTRYLLFGIFIYGCLLLTGSRGGMLFGGIEFGICVITLLIVDKKKRKLNITIFAVIILIALISMPDLKGLLSKTLERFVSFKENKIRLGLYTRAVEDFKSNPITGRGIGYMGNRDIHKSVEFALCWYHSTPFQIIGSFGVIGIVAYLFQYITRIKIFIQNRKNFFNITIFISYIGVELMSLVNPGVFSAIPYLLIVTMFFVIIDKCNVQGDVDEYIELRAGNTLKEKELQKINSEEN